MAEILIKFNTADKSLTATIDGKELEDVYEASVYKCYSGEGDQPDQFDFCITTCDMDEDSGLHTHTRISASEVPSGKAIASEKESFKIPELPGFVAAIGNDSLNEKVQAYLVASRGSKVRK